MIYAEVETLRKERKKNESTYWLIPSNDLGDLFRFILLKKNGDKFPHRRHQKSKWDSWRRDSADFQRLVEGGEQ